MPNVEIKNENRLGRSPDQSQQRQAGITTRVGMPTAFPRLAHMHPDKPPFLTGTTIRGHAARDG
ncbi:hypothetical protein RRF57_004088 [Xylaria bambusicola]|uniref:Uncharacterized protein n=1 Tax=Xylaria bambusicola TaxID=326684 RepID=A0AAN7Z669_9PEZI